HVLAGVDRDHARHGARGSRAHRGDARVRAIGTQERAVELPGEIPVGGVAALALQEPRVFAASGEWAHHTSRETSTTRSSFFHCSSGVSLLPWCVLEKPHCGDRQRFSIATYFAASSMRRLRWSLVSSCGVFDDTRPSTTFLPCGTKRSGSK